MTDEEKHPESWKIFALDAIVLIGFTWVLLGCIWLLAKYLEG